MILCVDKTALKTDLTEVQRDVDLEDIINNHTKYFDTLEEAYSESYVPLDFSVSIRSMYSNLVVEYDSETEDGLKKKMYYTNLTEVNKFVHKGYDLIMYITSIGVMYNINYSKGFDECMMRHSQFVPIGLFNPDPNYINPIIYCHIILSDEGAEEMKQYLKNNRRFVPIRNMLYEGNLRPMLNTLIEVKQTEGNTIEVPKFEHKKGESKDESDNNN